MSSEITLTRSHVIFVQASNGGEQMTKYARDILLGDLLLHEETGTRIWPAFFRGDVQDGPGACQLDQESWELGQFQKFCISFHFHDGCC